MSGKMKNSNKINELLENQNHILEAIKNLNERLEVIEERISDEHYNDVKDILESQLMIDELIVKNSDEIGVIKKIKEDNASAIKVLESKIENIDKEIMVLGKNEEKTEPEVQKKCSYYDKGFCRQKDSCKFYHPEKSCGDFRKDGICQKSFCRDRHPKMCRYWKRGFCFRGDSCCFTHTKKEDASNDKADFNIDKTGKESTIEEADNNENDIANMDVENSNERETKTETKTNKTCRNCKSTEISNQCDKCENYFCSNCEIKVHSESVLKFFKSYKFLNYTCNTAHK